MNKATNPQSCASCAKKLNSWDKRCSKALGYKSAVCEACIAAEYDKTVEELRDVLEDFFGMRPCKGI